MSASTEDTNAPTLRLDRMLDFTPDDLDANRRGEISEPQREKLRQLRAVTLKNHRQSGIFIISVMAAGTILAVVFGNLPLAGMGAMVTPLMAVTFAGSWLMTRFSTRRLLDPAVRSAEGTARLTTGTTRGGSKIYGVKIGRRQFYVAKDDYNTFEQGKAYRLYYVEGAPYSLLSVEQL